jgi:hypothetical protein
VTEATGETVAQLRTSFIVINPGELKFACFAIRRG